MDFFIQTLFSAPTFFTIYIVIIVFSICVHEYSHARVALWQGDDTGAALGHLSLNPMRQMGIISLIMLALVGIAWGSVPVNKANYKHRYSDALVSLAGPFANLTLCLAFALISQICQVTLGNYDIHDLVRYLYLASSINMLLFLFNMIPCYPFDGWFIFSNFIPIRKLNPEHVTSISLGIMIAIFAFIDYLWKLADYLSLIIFGVFDYIFVTLPNHL